MLRLVHPLLSAEGLFVRCHRNILTESWVLRIRIFQSEFIAALTFLLPLLLFSLLLEDLEVLLPSHGLLEGVLSAELPLVILRFLHLVQQVLPLRLEQACLEELARVFIGCVVLPSLFLGTHVMDSPLLGRVSHLLVH